MIVIWVTWTNWKTTTTNIIAKSLKNTGKKVFMFSTLNYIIWDEEYVNNTKMTSPDPFLLQKLFLKARKKWCDIAVIEVSSHALFYNRVWGINFDYAVLTNITQDHLDLHQNMNNYVRTKLKLFSSLISSARKKNIKKTAIINMESEFKDLFLNETYDNMLTYWDDFRSNIKYTDLKFLIDWTIFKVKIPWETINIKTKLRWKHNISNILRAIAVLTSMWINPRIIEESIEKIDKINGRLEEIDNDEWFKIFIDYAHTPDALEKVLDTLNNIEGRWRIITVFWATWDRDRIKRPIMGQIVREKSDYLILTEDDNYSEPITQIVKDVLPWITKKEWENFFIILKRQEAIRTALLLREKNDIILIAWKWDEHIMVTNDWPIDYNDKEVVLQILKEMDDNKIIK